MRVILTGATGFVGGEVLKQLLADEGAEAVTCLSRRPVETRHPKLATVLHADFTQWSTELATTLVKNDPVIWA